jgi:tetratricopeptide (TPR) repeat protein
VGAELAGDQVKAAQVDKLLSNVRNRELILQREHSVFVATDEYIFKHALLRDVTYETVLLKLRRVYHAQVAQWLERTAGERIGEYLSLIARHYELAGEMAKAIDFMRRSGEELLKVGASRDAARAFERALALLPDAGYDDLERTGQELGLQLPLAVALMNLKGFGDPEVGQAFAHAQELCNQIGETPQIFIALFGLGTFYCAKAEYKSAIEMAEWILRIAPKAPDPSVLLLIGHTGQAANLSFVGESKQALMHVEQFLDIYDPQKHDSLVFVLGQDLKSNSMSWATTDLWLRGYPDQAREMSRDTLALARKRAYPNALIFAFNWANILYHFCRDVQTLQELAEEYLALSTEYGAQMWIGAATIFRGWSLVEQGSAEDGIAEMRQGLAIFRTTGSHAFHPYFLTMMAEAHGKAGQLEEGLATLDEGLACVEKTGERFYEAEIHRLKGELLLAQGADEAEVEERYKQAIAVARQLEAKSLELRAVMSLSRLRHAQEAQGKREQAQQMLEEIYAWFTEGFDTADLQEAKALLEELAHS